MLKLIQSVNPLTREQIMIINTSNNDAIKLFLKKLYLPKGNTHKGQNGRLLIIGGSSLFHSASIWSAAIASRFVDIVHYCSTRENQKIFINLKSKFLDGIIIKKKDLLDYVFEDDCVLIGSGMIRGKIDKKLEIRNWKLEEIIRIKNEAAYTYLLTKYLIENYPDKKFVFDAGALQMMKKEWLLKMKTKPILTPHQKEFEQLFGISIIKKTTYEKIKIIKTVSKKYNCYLLVKAVVDIITDGEKTFVIEGGNPGLTKGGTGDVLAGLVAALNTKNDQITAMVLGSFFLKKAADDLKKEVGLWFNPSDLVSQIPKTINKIVD